MLPQKLIKTIEESEYTFIMEDVTDFEDAISRIKDDLSI